MYRAYTYFSLFLVLIFCQSSCSQQENGNRSIHYFGQKPPGLIPEIFAPGFISTEAWEAAGTFSPDGKEYFFTRRPTEEGSVNRLYHTSFLNGKWQPPKLASFAQDIFEMEPHIAPSGDIIFFNSKRSKPAGISMRGEIWYVIKTVSGWGEAHYLNSPLNNGFTMYVSAAKNGTLYFTASYNRQYGIYRTIKINEAYGPPEYLAEGINGIYGASHPFIDPDERFLIFDAQVSGVLKPELFISFRLDDGTWSKAVNMGNDINATRTEIAASISPDGKHLFFHRTVDGNGDIYWVDAAIINSLKPK